MKNQNNDEMDNGNIIQCGHCDGTGSWRGDRCPKCNGDGYIEADAPARPRVRPSRPK
jgi:DnaJ-class molecular chaperone